MDAKDFVDKLHEFLTYCSENAKEIKVVVLVLDEEMNLSTLTNKVSPFEALPMLMSSYMDISNTLMSVPKGEMH